MHILYVYVSYPCIHAIHTIIFEYIHICTCRIADAALFFFSRFPCPSSASPAISQPSPFFVTSTPWCDLDAASSIATALGLTLEPGGSLFVNPGLTRLQWVLGSGPCNLFGQLYLLSNRSLCQAVPTCHVLCAKVTINA